MAPRVGKAGRGWREDRFERQPPHYSVQLLTLLPIPKAGDAPWLGPIWWLHRPATLTFPAPRQAQSQGSLLLQPMASIWEELKVITQSTAACDFKLLNWE